jgi:hypothetical protein
MNTEFEAHYRSDLPSFPEGAVRAGGRAAWSSFSEQAEAREATHSATMSGTKRLI